MLNSFVVTFEEAGEWFNQKRVIYASDFDEAQKLACLLCDDHKRRVLSVDLAGVQAETSC